MSAIWSEECQFRTWLDVEIFACEGWHQLGKIPDADWQTIKTKSTFDIAKIKEKEKETRHDVAAFVSEVQSHLGPAGRFVHMGLTSSDVVDTALCYRLKKSGELILKELDLCLEITRDRAIQDRETMVMGRTHGIHAEPTSFGLKWLLWHDMLKRSRARLVTAIEDIAVGKLSGAVGNYAHLPPEIEALVCERLGLKVDTISTQVVTRDRHAAYFGSLSLLGSCVETIAVELRHLQRTELSEVREGFTKGQKGSSAMPHKRNPISAENLTGLARLLRSYSIPTMENCALWHERDISHSSVERVIGPDANILADYVLSRLAGLLKGLEVFPVRMMENLEQLQGVVFSQKVLLSLIDAGMSRDEAYEIVQKNALAALDSRRPFRDLLKADPRVSKVLSGASLDVLFDLRHYLKHLDYLYQKVLPKKDADK